MKRNKTIAARISATVISPVKAMITYFIAAQYASE